MPTLREGMAPSSRVLPRRRGRLLRRSASGHLRQQIEEALLRVEGTAPHYLIEIDRPDTMDEVKVSVEIRPQDFSDKMSQMQVLRDRIDREIQSVTGIRAMVELVEPQTLERSAGKAKRVIDHRKEKGIL